MRTPRKQAKRTFSLERLEGRALLTGGGQGSAILPAGALNPSFGQGGIVRSSALGSTDDIAAGVSYQRQGDGKIVVAGTARGVNSQSSFALARYNIDGTLDTSFGNKGTAYTPFLAGTVAASASNVAVQADGKILVVGTINGFINGNSEEEFAIARYNSNGTLDTAFGTGGEVTTAFGPDSFASATSIALAPNGKIVVAGGTSIEGAERFAVARYTSNGSLDPTFGFGGEAAVGLGSNFNVFTAGGVVVQASGKVVIAGTAAEQSNGFSSDFALARLNANGSLDTSFGNGGQTITQFAGVGASSVAGMAIEPGTGAIVVAGTVQDPANGFDQEFAMARYNPLDGSLDTTFGTGGEVVTLNAPSVTATVTGVAIQPSNGDILLVGTSSGFDFNSTFFQDLTLNRYNVDGTPDTSFGIRGQVLTGFGTSSRTTGAGVIVQPDGKIVATGSLSFSNGGTAAGFLTARFNARGTLDHGFATRGEVITNIASPSGDSAASEVIQPDGKIVVLGTASVFDPNGFDFQDFVITRFNKDGSLDTHFGNNGSVLLDFGTGSNQAAALALQADGKIVVVGTIRGTIFDDFEDMGVARLNTNGALDKTFGTGGEILVDFGEDGSGDPISSVAASVVVQSNGKIVLAGTASGFDEDDDFFQDVALARYNSNGRLDGTFGTGGQVLTSFGPSTFVSTSGAALQADGKIVVAGTATDQNTFVNEFEVSRYNSNGKLDGTFGTGGEVFTSFGADRSATVAGLVVQPNGKIVLAGTTIDPITFNNVFALTRYNSNGKADSAFGTAGKLTASFGDRTSATAASIALQPDGMIVVAGSVLDFRTSFDQDFGVARFHSNGVLDTTFGTGGVALASFGDGVSDNAAGVAIDSNGDIIVAGTTSDISNSYLTLVDLTGKRGRHS